MKPEDGASSRPLLDALNFKLSEFLTYDLLAAVLGAIGGGIRWATRDGQTAGILGVAAGLVGVVIGGVIAAAALQAAFMDKAFLLKLRYLDYRPSYFLAPALWTGVLGVIASLLLLMLLGLPSNMPTWLDAVGGAFAGFFVVYTIVSLIPVLRMIVEFTDLKADAALIADDDPRLDEG